MLHPACNMSIKGNAQTSRVCVGRGSSRAHSGPALRPMRRRTPIRPSRALGLGSVGARMAGGGGAQGEHFASATPSSISSLNEG